MASGAGQRQGQKQQTQQQQTTKRRGRKSVEELDENRQKRADEDSDLDGQDPGTDEEMDPADDESVRLQEGEDEGLQMAVERASPFFVPPESIASGLEVVWLWRRGAILWSLSGRQLDFATEDMELFRSVVERLVRRLKPELHPVFAVVHPENARELLNSRMLYGAAGEQKFLTRSGLYGKLEGKVLALPPGEPSGVGDTSAFPYIYLDTLMASRGAPTLPRWLEVRWLDWMLGELGLQWKDVQKSSFWSKHKEEIVGRYNAFRRLIGDVLREVCGLKAPPLDAMGAGSVKKKTFYETWKPEAERRVGQDNGGEGR
ncbi:MAG: hypothetical protein K9L28_06945 [Synergistales bacterium]|nr:hypothetical protein [Synergistales bacterium]